MDVSSIHCIRHLYCMYSRVVSTYERVCVYVRERERERERGGKV